MLANTGFVHALVESLCLSPVCFDFRHMPLKACTSVASLVIFLKHFLHIFVGRIFMSSSCTPICPISLNFSTRFSFLAVFPNKSMLSKIFFRVELQQRQVLSDALHRFFEISLMATIFSFLHANRAFHTASRTVSSSFLRVFELANYKRFHCSSCKPVTNVVGIRVPQSSSLPGSHTQKSSGVEIDAMLCYWRRSAVQWYRRGQRLKSRSGVNFSGISFASTQVA